MTAKKTALHEYIVWYEDQNRRIKDKIIFVKAAKKKPQEDIRRAIYKHYPEVFHAEFIGTF